MQKAPPLAGKSTRIEWLKPVYADDVLTAAAEVTASIPRSPRNGLAELTIHACNQHGDLVLTNNLTEAVVKRRPRAAGAP